MIELKTEKPKQECIYKLKNVICLLLSIFFIILIILYIQFKNTFSLFDKTLFYITIISQLLTLYSCFVKWCCDTLMYIHYIFVIMLYIVLLSENITLLGYYLCVVIFVVAGWKLNNNVCIFGNLSWDVDIINYEIRFTKTTLDRMIYSLLLAYPLKIFYSMK